MRTSPLLLACLLGMTLLNAQPTTPAVSSTPAGFLFVTFDSESTPMGEQIYFGLSADGRNWSALNKSKPLLVSGLGEKACVTLSSSALMTGRRSTSSPPNIVHLNGKILH